MSATTQDMTREVSRFMDSIQEPRKPYISPSRFAKAAGVSVQALAALAGVHRNTVSQHPDSDRLQDRLRDMVKAIVAAVAVTGDLDKAIYWFRNEPIADYRHKTAAELVADGRLDAVLAFLEDLRNGASG
jgi:AcrR family transcriptional regulator